jgi:hypothetical protein
MKPVFLLFGAEQKPPYLLYEERMGFPNIRLLLFLPVELLYHKAL